VTSGYHSQLTNVKVEGFRRDITANMEHTSIVVTSDLKEIKLSWKDVRAADKDRQQWRQRAAHSMTAVG